MVLPSIKHRSADCTDTLDDAEERRLQIEKNQSAIALLKSWLEDDSESEEEQRAALNWLMRALDEDRPLEFSDGGAR